MTKATMGLNDLPPPPYQAQAQTPSRTPATSALRNPVIFHITCPLQSNYLITDTNGEAVTNTHNHEWSLKPDLVFHRADASTRELVSCDFKEKTLTADMAFTKDVTGEPYTLWWSAMEADVSLASKYRFMAKVQNANPLDISGFSVTSPRPFVWGRMGDGAWRLVDEFTGNVAAVAYGEEDSLGNPGTLEILMTYGEVFSLIAVTSYVTLCEKGRREGKSKRHFHGLDWVTHK